MSNPSPAGPCSLAGLMRELEQIDGGSSFHNATYYASTADAELARYRTMRMLRVASDIERARRIEVMKLWAAGEHACSWCANEFLSLTDVLALADRLVHKHCNSEFAEFTRGRICITPLGRRAVVEDDRNAEHEAVA